MNYKLLSILIVAQMLLAFSVFAKVRIGDVTLKKTSNNRAALIVKYSGKLVKAPDTDFSDTHIQLVLTGAEVWPKINKKMTIDKRVDATLMAYQYNKKVVRVRAYLPKTVSGHKKIHMNLTDSRIILSFPYDWKEVAKVSTATPIKKAVVVAAKKKAVSKVKNKKATDYDEEYLDRLLGIPAKGAGKTAKKAKTNKLAKKETTKKTVKETAKESDFFNSLLNKGSKKVDKVTTKLSGTATLQDSEKSDGFSYMQYIGKFVAFLGLVLLLFYGIVALMKKGVISKGKLGFLNKTQAVTILNTTYVGPKRSILMIKVHDQIFMVGSSEAGITMLSEVSDVNGVLKEGEKAIAGNNFDTTFSNLDDLANLDGKIKLKKDTTSVVPENTKVKDVVKFSDRIKQKVKDLKPLH